MDQLTAYRTLGLEYKASSKEIRQAYAELSKRYHPEESPVEFQRIHEAYTTLTRRARRTINLENSSEEEQDIIVMQRESVFQTMQDTVFVTEDEQKEQLTEYDFEERIEKSIQRILEERIQDALNELDKTVTRDKEFDIKYLRKVLSETEKDILYNEKCLNKIVCLIKENRITRTVKRVMMVHLQMRDEKLLNEIEGLQTVRDILEERNKECYNKTNTKFNNLFSVIIIGIILYIWAMKDLGSLICVVAFIVMLVFIYKIAQKKLPIWKASCVDFFIGGIFLVLVSVFDWWQYVTEFEFLEVICQLGAMLMGVLFFIAFSEAKKEK